MEPSCAWLPAMRRYLAVIAVGNLAWEVAQLPLYTLWRTASTQDIALAVVHCTGGDVLLAAVSLLGSLLLLGADDWPKSRVLPVAATAIVFGVAYTVYSEHLNTASNAWTYSDLMPVLPGVGTGLAPLTQWVVVPTLAFGAIHSPWWRKTRAHRPNAGLDLPTIKDTTSIPTPDHSARSSGRAS